MTARKSMKRCTHGGDRKSDKINSPCGVMKKSDEAELFNVGTGTINRQHFVDDHSTEEQKEEIRKITSKLVFKELKGQPNKKFYDHNAFKIIKSDNLRNASSQEIEGQPLSDSTISITDLMDYIKKIKPEWFNVSSNVITENSENIKSKTETVQLADIAQITDEYIKAYDQVTWHKY